MNEVLLKYWMLCAVTLAAKMWMNSAIQVVVRLKHKQFVNSEDAKAVAGIFRLKIEASQDEHPTVARAALCWRNDLENIPLFLILALGFVLVGGDTEWGVGYLIVYTLARIGHTVFYMTMLQPWRTIVFEIGAITTVAVAAHAIYVAFR